MENMIAEIIKMLSPESKVPKPIIAATFFLLGLASYFGFMVYVLPEFGISHKAMGEIETLNDNKNQLTKDIEQAKQQKHQLEKDSLSLQNSYDSKSKDTAKLESDIALLNNNTKELQQDIQELQEKLETSKKELDVRARKIHNLAELEKAYPVLVVENKVLLARLEGLARENAALNSTIQSLSKNVSSPVLTITKQADILLGAPKTIHPNQLVSFLDDGVTVLAMYIKRNGACLAIDREEQCKFTAVGQRREFSIKGNKYALRVDDSYAPNDHNNKVEADQWTTQKINTVTISLLNLGKD